MLPVRSTSLDQSGKRTRKPTTSSKSFEKWWLPYPCMMLLLLFCRHALREYNIHKKLDHLVSGLHVAMDLCVCAQWCMSCDL